MCLASNREELKVIHVLQHVHFVENNPAKVQNELGDVVVLYTNIKDKSIAHFTYICVYYIYIYGLSVPVDLLIACHHCTWAENYIIAQVYRLSAVHCQMTQRVLGYLTRYSVSANEISFDKKISKSDCVFQIRLGLEENDSSLHLVTSTGFLKA